VYKQLSNISAPRLNQLSGGGVTQAGRAAQFIDLNLSLNGKSEVGRFPNSSAMTELVNELNKQKRATRG